MAPTNAKTEEASASSSTPKRRTRPKGITPISPEAFFNELIQGLLASEGIAGVFSDSAISILANPQNAPRWYGAYLTLCRNWDAFIEGENVMRANLVPPSVAEVLKELNPDAVKP